MRHRVGPSSLPGFRVFTERLTQLPPTLQPFRPGPAADDRAAWLALPDEVQTALIAEGEQALATPYPPLPATLYLDFHRTGQRTPFEDSYFARRRLLNALVMAECVEHRGRFLDRIVEDVMLLCEESGWQLPAHNALVRDGPRLPLPDPDRPVIDLFAAESGAQLAVIAVLLKPELDAVSPQLAQRIDREIAQRIIEPYLSYHFWWMGDGDEPMNNWTAWCTQNVLLTVFTRPFTQETGGRIVRQAAASLDAFLKDYGDDGACEEGVLYYRHAGLCLFNALQVLDAVAPGAFSGVWREPKLRNIAEYPVRVHVAGDWYFNFADCPARAGACGAREFLFGRAAGSPTLTDFAAADWRRERLLTLPEEINLFYRVQAACAVRGLETHRSGPARPANVYLPSVGLFVARDDHFALAVKAGDNGDSHNHNDVSGVILYKDGRPVLIDVGVESYTAKTFSPQRYEIWTMQSAWHNLPTFDSVMQQDGEAFAARDVRTSFDLGRASIEMEIAGAYPADAGISTYRRRVTLTGSRTVEIADSYRGQRAAELSLMFEEKPRFEAGSIVLDDLAQITLTGAGTPRRETIPITDPRLRKTWPERLYRVLVPLTREDLRLVIQCDVAAEAATPGPPTSSSDRRRRDSSGRSLRPG